MTQMERDYDRLIKDPEIVIVAQAISETYSIQSNWVLRLRQAEAAIIAIKSLGYVKR